MDLEFSKMVDKLKNEVKLKKIEQISKKRLR